jgi:8-oxo-dGTP diphosphatase
VISSGLDEVGIAYSTLMSDESQQTTPPCNRPTHVVCLVLRDAEGRVLVTQRPEGKRLALLWEFPGGKVEAGESLETALRREIREELGIEVDALEPFAAVHHEYDYGSIYLQPFISACEQHPELSLNEHKDAQWIFLSDWKQLLWAPADIPIVEKLLRHGSQAVPE